MTRNRRGATLVFALAVMLAVSVACASMLAVSLTATQSAYAQQEQEQGYLASVGASNVVKRLFDTSSEEAVTLLAGLSRQGDNKQDLEITLDSGDTARDKKINSALASKLTLMKDENDKVTITVNTANASSAYQTSLTVPVRTVLFYIGDTDGDNFYSQRTYPANYPEASVNSILNALLRDFKEAHTLPDGRTEEDYYTSSWESLGKGQNAPTPAVEPTKAPDGNYFYKFREWDIVSTESDMTYTPLFSKYKLLVFLDDTKEPSVSLEKYFEDNFPSVDKFSNTADFNFEDYPGSFPPGYNPYPDKIAPSAPEEGNTYYEYVLTWVLSGSADASLNARTYAPTFTLRVKTPYTIQWKNDGTVFESYEMTTEKTEEPAHPATNPTKTDETYVYTFTGWSDARMEGSIKIYEAQFDSRERIQYTKIWLNGDGTELDRKTFKEGFDEPDTDKTPFKASDETYDYNFTGWTKSEDGATITMSPNFTETPKTGT